MADVPATRGTTAEFEGLSFFGALIAAYSGELETSADRDWIRVDLVAGQSYQFVTDAGFGDRFGVGAVSATLRTSDGVAVAEGNNLSKNVITYTAATTGEYYLDLSQFSQQQYPNLRYNSLVIGPSKTIVDFNQYDGASDRLVLGGSFNDVYSIGARCAAFGAFSFDTITSNAAGGVLAGANGDDYLIGREGGDIAWGGWGDDLADGDAGNDLLFGDQGNDSLDGDAGADTLSGGAGSDIVEGGLDNDILDGGAGADRVEGGGGNDIIYVESSNDVVIELNDDFFDQVAARNSYTLTGGAYVELLTTTSSSGVRAITLIGNNLSQAITGNDGRNSLAGLDGADVLIGNGGADFLTGGAGLDSASYESAPRGVLVSLANPSINTGDAAGDTFNGIERLIGSIFGDGLNGDSAENTLNGGAGNDTLKSYAGFDILTGGEGADAFVFNSALAGGLNYDRINDFGFGADRIWLDNAVFTAFASTGAMPASAFKRVDLDTGVDSNDRILYDQGLGDLYYDRDGSGTAFGRIRFADLADGTVLDASDFLII